jgi:hypothetical protein
MPVSSLRDFKSIDFMHKPQSNPDADPLNHGDTETLRKNKGKTP